MAETAVQPAVSFDERFWSSVEELDPGKARRVVQALNLFRDNADHPNLHLKPLRGELGDLMSVRAGRDVRVLLVKRGDTYVWIEAGLRRDIYDKAGRGRFVVNPARNFMGFVDATVEPEDRRRPLPASAATESTLQRGAFDHWSTPELAAAGFSDSEIAELRACSDEYGLLELPWPDERIDRAVALVEQTPEQWAAKADGSAVSDPETRMREAIEQFGGLTGISPLYSFDQLQELLAAPVEDWMIFLHPAQRDVVERTYQGPARVRGAAGTGKTVVGLHRAAHLARRVGQGVDGRPPILFTTLIDSLPPVLAELYRRMPGAPEGGVEFTHVNHLADQVCRSAGLLAGVDPAAVEEAWIEACKAVLVEGSPLSVAPVSHAYLQAEIERVLKGRGVRSLEDYLVVARTGRGVGLTRRMREQIWALHERWAAEMLSRGTLSPGDLVLEALRVSADHDGPWYRSAVIDEAQDLTLVGLQLVRRLVNGPSGGDRPDALFIVGDAAQRVLAGGFTLRQAGVEVRGRTTVLQVNYRNTAEIIEAALAVAGAEDVVDLDEEFRRGELAPIAVRHGPKPTLRSHVDRSLEMTALVEQVRTISASSLTALGDIAVFVPSSEMLPDIVAALAAGDVPHQTLSEYRGLPVDAVKVGTYRQAKGLEFKAVILPGVGQGVLPGEQRADETTEEYEERRSIEMSRLFVAMTRARDELAVSSAGPPNDCLERAVAAFDTADGHA